MRLVIRSPDARRARALQDALASCGVDAVALIGPAAYRPCLHGEDIALVDGQADEAADLVRAVRRDVGAALAYVGLTMFAHPPGIGLDAWVALDSAPETVRARLDAIHRDAILTEETRARRRTAAALGRPAPPEPVPPRQISVLYVGAPAPECLALEWAWAQAGARVAATFTSFSAFDHLHDDRYDAVILNATEDPAAALSLCGAMRRNAQLYHVPVMVLVAREDEDTAAGARKRGATLVAKRGDDLALGVAWLCEDVRRARLRRIAADIAASAPEETAPWSLETFGAHLDTLAQAHHNRGRALTLGCLRARGAPTNTEAFARGFADLSGLAARLVRASDAIASADAGALLFAFPSTGETGARAALKRIVSVWECTSFAAGDKGAPLRFEAHGFELAPGESGAGLLRRAQDALDGISRRA